VAFSASLALGQRTACRSLLPMLPMRCACPQQPAPLPGCHVLTGPALPLRNGVPWCFSETPLLVQQTGPIDGPDSRRGNVFYFFTSSTMNFSSIDWSQAPEDARWWAMDGDGHAYWYCRPQIAAATTFWFAARHPAPSFGYARDFRQSLQARPAPAEESAPARAAASRLLRR
jgi:hypothetical protein